MVHLTIFRMSFSIKVFENPLKFHLLMYLNIHNKVLFSEMSSMGFRETLYACKYVRVRCYNAIDFNEFVRNGENHLTENS